MANNCVGGSSSPEIPCMVAALFRVNTTHIAMELERASQQLSMFGNVGLLFRNVAETLLWLLVGRTTLKK